MNDFANMYDNSLYILKLMIVVIVYLSFVTLTKRRSKKLTKDNKKVPREFLGIHIDLYTIFIPIYIILIMIVF